MKFGVVVFPGSNCDHDAWYAVSHNLGHQAEFIWHDSTAARRRRRCDPARRILLRRLPALRRHRAIFARDAGREEIRRGRRTRARHLQRLSDPCRERAAARRADAQRGPEIHLQAGRPDASKRRIRRSPAAHKGQFCACRSPTAKATTSPTTARSTNSKPRTASPSAMSTTRTARSATSPAS